MNSVFCLQIDVASLTYCCWPETVASYRRLGVDDGKLQRRLWSRFSLKCTTYWRVKVALQYTRMKIKTSMRLFCELLSSHFAVGISNSV